jgi:putative membrane protein
MSYLDDPRVFFAAERTLLAWQRSSIAMMGLGLLNGVRGHGGSQVSMLVSWLLLLAAAFTALLSSWQFRRFLGQLSGEELPRGHMTWPGPVMNLLIAASAIVMALVHLPL